MEIGRRQIGGEQALTVRLPCREAIAIHPTIRQRYCRPRWQAKDVSTVSFSLVFFFLKTCITYLDPLYPPDDIEIKHSSL